MHQLFAVADAANRLPLPIDLLSAAREMKSIQAYAVMSDMPADHDGRGLGRVQLPWTLQCRQALASPGAGDGIQTATGEDTTDCFEFRQCWPRKYRRSRASSGKSRISRGGTRIAKGQVNLEKAMTLNLTPYLTIRIRRATDAARHIIHTETRRLSITSLSFLKLEVVVFKYRGK